MSTRNRPQNDTKATPLPYDPEAFTTLRGDLDALLLAPVHAWHVLPAGMRTETAYCRVLMVPLDLASVGVTVAVCQREAGWTVDLVTVVSGHTLRVQGQAVSYAAALFQLANTAPQALDDLARQARRAAEAGEVAA